MRERKRKTYNLFSLLAEELGEKRSAESGNWLVAVDLSPREKRDTDSWVPWFIIIVFIYLFVKFSGELKVRESPSGLTKITGRA